MCDENIYLFKNFKVETVEVWEWINNFIIHSSGHIIINSYSIGHMIIYPYWV